MVLRSCQTCCCTRRPRLTFAAQQARIVLSQTSIRPQLIQILLNHNAACGDQVISGTSVQLCCSGGYMPTLADIYEYQAEDCLRAAAKADDPQRRALMLKLAHAWRKDAEALKRGEKLQPASAPRKAKAFGRGAEGTPDLHLSSCGVTRFEWGQTSVELYEPQLQRTMRG